MGHPHTAPALSARVAPLPADLPADRFHAPPAPPRRLVERIPPATADIPHEGSSGIPTVGCGLCGIESIEQAVRQVPDVSASPLSLSHADIVRAVSLLNEAQPLHRETRAVHGAGFYLPARGLLAVREDVGRHNALDKLCGAVIRAGESGGGGAVAVTSRLSVEMVQKAAILGSPVLIAISAPTALAIRTAEEAGMTLVALVRGEDFEIFTHPHRISPGSIADVA